MSFVIGHGDFFWFGSYNIRLIAALYKMYLFLQESDVRRIAVGIGSGIDLRELREIASFNDDVLQVATYDQLYPKLEVIMNMTCEEQYPGMLTKHKFSILRVTKNYGMDLASHHGGPCDGWLRTH